MHDDYASSGVHMKSGQKNYLGLDKVFQILGLLRVRHKEVFMELLAHQSDPEHVGFFLEKAKRKIIY